MKALLERYNSLYPSNTLPVPNLRKCKSSVNMAEAAPLQFSPHSGGERSISGESMVSLWLTHSKGSGEGRVREYVHVCRASIYLILQVKTDVILLDVIVPIGLYFQVFTVFRCAANTVE